MTEYVYVKPRDGGRVRMPDREFRVMDAAGATVPRIDFYERLILTGDVVICSPPAPVAAEPAVVEVEEAPPPVLSSAASRAQRSPKES